MDIDKHLNTHHWFNYQWFYKFLVENGAFYISRVKDILESNCRVSGKIALVECSEYSYYEIDEESDFNIIESILGE